MEDNRAMRARVIWFGPEFGGRESGPPLANEYRPNALFLTPQPHSSHPMTTEFGSVRFILGPRDPSDVELDFWSPQELDRYIYDSSPFMVMEGTRPVGFARMFEARSLEWNWCGRGRRKVQVNAARSPIFAAPGSQPREV